MTKSNPSRRPQRSARLAWVRCGDINVNPAAQREFRPLHAQNLLNEFDIDKFQAPHVNKRADGSLYVMEGQHSIWAYRNFFGEDAEVQVWIYDDLGEPKEADYFLSLNNKKNVDAMAKFKAAVTAGRAEECDIDRIVRANGCVVSSNASDNAIQAIGALVTIYQRFGARVLGQTLRVIRGSFVDGGFERPVLIGTAMVLARYADSIDEDRLISKLASIRNGWKGLVQRTNNIKAAQGTTQAEAAAAAVVEFYNAGRGGVKLMTWWAA